MSAAGCSPRRRIRRARLVAVALAALGWGAARAEVHIDGPSCAGLDGERLRQQIDLEPGT